MAENQNVKPHQFFKNKSDITITVLTNIIKMLTERGLLNKSDLNKNIKDITSKHPDDLVYKIKNKDNKLTTALLYPYKVTSVTKTSAVNDFLNAYKNEHKIIIVKDINKKSRQHIINNYSNSEIFLEEILMINLIDHELVPDHKVGQYRYNYITLILKKLMWFNILIFRHYIILYYNIYLFIYFILFIQFYSLHRDQTKLILCPKFF